MELTETLLAAHRARFAAVDAMLPPAAPPAEGEVLSAATANGTKVAGVLQRQRHDPDDVTLLWSSADVWQLFPYFGDTGTEGIDLLLRALRSRLDGEDVGDDSSCLVCWPSRDAEAIRAFLDHGFVPLSALAVRTERPPPAIDGVTVRRAGPGDFDAALALAECAWVDAAPGTERAELLPPGRWGYVNNVVTALEERGGGLGQALMAHVHQEFHAAGVAGTYLYYNPTNPLSSVFWHRQGYRPLWTTWEVRPASALR